MSDNFGLKIGLEGEKEFKKSLAEINNSFKVLGSEMKLVDSQFDKNDKSTEALTARSEVLNKEIDSQKQKIVTTPGVGLTFCKTQAFGNCCSCKIRRWNRISYSFSLICCPFFSSECLTIEKKRV